MATDDSDLWQALLAVTGDQVATEADYEHGYKREMRSDLLRYVTFMIGGEIYGLPIEQIIEISTAFPTTPVPRTSAFVIGIGNMRGSVMPVIDLARRLNLGTVKRGRETRVLIVRHDDEPHGIVVDRVLEVISRPRTPRTPPVGSAALAQTSSAASAAIVAGWSSSSTSPRSSRSATFSCPSSEGSDWPSDE